MVGDTDVLNWWRASCNKSYTVASPVKCLWKDPIIQRAWDMWVAIWFDNEEIWECRNDR